MNDYEYNDHLVEEFKKTLIFCKGNLLNLKLDISSGCQDVEVEITCHGILPFHFYSKKCLMFEMIKEEYEKYLSENGEIKC